MATTDSPTDAPSRPYDRADIHDLPRDERRRLYERIIRIADANASQTQLPWTRQVIVKRLACEALPCRYDAILKLIDDLVEAKRLLRWSDADDYRVVCVRDPATLARVHTVLGNDGYHRPRLRAWILKHLEAARG